MSPSNLVSMEWVKEHLDHPEVVLVDCRFVLGSPQTGRQEYDVMHIPGAFHMDLEKDLSGPKQKHGGRHPLPDLDELARKLGEIGIDAGKKVIGYDDQGGSMASRFWWMLKYLGHEQVYVMDGSFTQWKAKGYPVTSKPPQAVPTSFIPAIQSAMLADMKEVKSKLGKEGTVLIDAREEKRFRGIEEPIDAVAGHIPGAMNFFWKDNLTSEGTWKPVEEQKKRFQAISPSDEVIVYCGSGVSACPNILALSEAGFKNLKLYVGSWSDWSSYPENPIETEKE